MTKRVRFSLDLTVPPTVTDAFPAVRHGVLREGGVIECGKERFDLKAVRLLPPCSPTKIVCVGRNYGEHAKELGNETPAEPLLFFKPPSSLLADGGEIVYPGLSSRVDYEGELGLVIGRRVRNVSRAEAWESIAGFTCVNDVTARDLQKTDGQWTRAKGFDTFCAVGPWLIPPEEVDLNGLIVRTRLNGELRQEGRVRDMIFPIPEILAYASRVMTLEPGDLIATGTPSGVGPMKPGDRVEVEIEGIGVLRNLVVEERQ